MPKKERFKVVGGDASLIVHKPGVEEAVRVSGPGDRTASSAVGTAGGVTYAIGGHAPQNEEGSLATGRRLVHRLREDGAEWGVIEWVGEDDVDCRSRWGDEVLNIQVFRAMPKDKWRNLHLTGQVIGATQAAELADNLHGAIDAKARVSPLKQRRGLVLAIDAFDTPFLATGTVVESFRESHQKDVAAYRFRSVWVVGPPGLVSRLDA